jgi:uncharacterized membrane protein (DUF485 family)
MSDFNTLYSTFTDSLNNSGYSSETPINYSIITNNQQILSNNYSRNSIKSLYYNNLLAGRTEDSSVNNIFNDYANTSNKMKINKMRQIEINNNYLKRYERQIYIIKKIILICVIGLIGCILFSNSLIGYGMLNIYLGIVLSVGFIVIFYDLWDIYIRNNNNFDEYDYDMDNIPHAWSDMDVSLNPIDLSRLKC